MGSGFSITQRQAPPRVGNHTVKAAFSHDLIHWSQQTEVFRDAETGTYGGPTESPFVVKRNGKYYLFVCTNRGYNETAVYESDTPLRWDAGKLVGRFPAHAAEVIQTPDGKWVRFTGWMGTRWCSRWRAWSGEGDPNAARSDQFGRSLKCWLLLAIFRRHFRHFRLFGSAIAVRGCRDNPGNCGRSPRETIRSGASTHRSGSSRLARRRSTPQYARHGTLCLAPNF